MTLVSSRYGGGTTGLSVPMPWPGMSFLSRFIYGEGHKGSPNFILEGRNKFHLPTEQWKGTGRAYKIGNTSILKTTSAVSGRTSEVVSEAKSLLRISRDGRRCCPQFPVCALGVLFWFLVFVSVTGVG